VLDRLSNADKHTLLHLARASVAAAAGGQPTPERPREPQVLSPRLLVPGAVFVSLHTRRQRLRGCIGCLEARNPLADAVIENAYAAATRDPRFDPIRPEDVHDLDIEISVLGPLVRVEQVTDIEVGRDGVAVDLDGCRGILLPQVPVQQGWDREEFLDNVCRKAELPADAWRRGASMQRFEADVFSESALDEPRTGSRSSRRDPEFRFHD